MLAAWPEQAFDAVHFVLEIPSVHALVMGMMSKEEILENIALVGELTTA